VYEKTGKLEYVQHFLGHADPKTTMEWYHYLLGETPALDMADFARRLFPLDCCGCASRTSRINAECALLRAAAKRRHWRPIVLSTRSGSALT
jgi:hypothetical protein